MFDLVADARAAIQFMKTSPAFDADQIFVLGHSEGGALLPLIGEDQELAGLIFLAAPSHSLGDVILWQLEQIFAFSNYSQEEIDAEIAKQKEFYQFVRETTGSWRDHTFEELNEKLPWFTYNHWQSATTFSLCWYREHLAYVPALAAHEIGLPVLILQGDKDAQIPPEDPKIIADTIQLSGNQNVDLAILPDLDHAMRHHTEEPFERNPNLDDPVDWRVLEQITDWVQKQTPIGDGLAFVNMLARDELEQIYLKFEFTDEVAAGLPLAKLREVWNGIKLANGQFERVVSATSQQALGFTVIIVTARFSERALNIIVTFDEDGRIAGLYFREAK